MTRSFDLLGILENQLHQGWAVALSRHPAQLNRTHEADAELVPLPGGDVLAATIDTITEEISTGLYRDAETIGWVGAVASLSDLAACGAEPIGLLVSATLPSVGASAFQQGLARGLEAACRVARTFVLGGDTNIAEQASITTCGLGLVRGGAVLTRVGALPGDDLYVTSKLGLGAVAAAAALFALPPEVVGEASYRPVPRLEIVRALRKVATAAMDTSDGFIATVDQLMRVNGVGFAIDVPVAQLLEPRALLVCQRLGLDPLVALAVHHGEFELVLTAPPGARDDIAVRAAACPPGLVRIGRVTESPEIVFHGDGQRRVDTSALRNLSTAASVDPKAYLGELVRHLNGDAACR
ncbi:MAG: thiamine-phosphate kinase [Myxococcota bacterium]|jgi:thiamine-monophosphate kinase|nr:thiamine-phosphate kinase [Myxococcota bacterium]